MSEKITTSNGHEIEHPTDIMDAETFRQHMAEEYGLSGETPGQRVEQLKQLSLEGFSILLQDINKSLQGSEDSLITRETTMKIGEQSTIPVEQRYDTFLRLVEAVKSAPEDINPARVGDVMAMGVALLHPFHDGNGRTARMLGLMFRDAYDNSDRDDPYGYVGMYDMVAAPRDKAREQGGNMIWGYVPKFPEGFDQSNGEEVSRYLSNLLYEEAPETGSYDGTYADIPAPLYK